MDAHKARVIIPCSGLKDKCVCRIKWISALNNENPYMSHQTDTELPFCLKEMNEDIKNYAI